MEKVLKIGLLWVLTMLVVCASNEVTGNNYEDLSSVNWQEECVLCPKLPEHNASECIHHLYSNQSCDMSHTETAQVPTDKSILLLIAYFCEHGKHQSAQGFMPPHLPAFFSDTITYYIYRLRKIVV